MFIKWATGSEYGKLIYAGEDFIEFNVVDVETMDYSETVLIHSPLILEVAIGGADIQRIVAEVSSKISIEEQVIMPCKRRFNFSLKRTFGKISEDVDYLKNEKEI